MFSRRILFILLGISICFSGLRVASAGTAAITVGAGDTTWPNKPAVEIFNPTAQAPFGSIHVYTEAELGDAQSFRVTKSFSADSIFVGYQAFNNPPRQTADVAIYRVSDVTANTLVTTDPIARGTALRIVPTSVKTDSTEFKFFRLDIPGGLTLNASTGNAGYALRFVAQGGTLSQPFEWAGRDTNAPSDRAAYVQGVKDPTTDFALALTGSVVPPPPTGVPLPPAAWSGLALLATLGGARLVRVRRGPQVS